MESLITLVTGDKRKVTCASSLEKLLSRLTQDQEGLTGWPGFKVPVSTVD